MVYQYLGLCRFLQQLLHMLGAAEVVEVDTEYKVTLFDSCDRLIRCVFKIDQFVVTGDPPQKIGHLARRHRRYGMAFRNQIVIQTQHAAYGITIGFVMCSDEYILRTTQ